MALPRGGGRGTFSGRFLDNPLLVQLLTYLLHVCRPVIHFTPYTVIDFARPTPPFIHFFFFYPPPLQWSILLFFFIKKNKKDHWRGGGPKKADEPAKGFKVPYALFILGSTCNYNRELDLENESESQTRQFKESAFILYFLA